MAVDLMSTSALPTLSAPWPMKTVAPSFSSRLTAEEADRSEPVIVKPMLMRTSAMPFMPEPPMPTM